VSKRARDDDAHAFAEAMRGAKPLAPDARARVPLPPEPARGARARVARARTEARALSSADALAESTAFQVETFGDAIEGRAVGIDAKVLRRLKAGELRVEARLDLHGQARDGALAALERFVESAREQDKRCLLVIHGRGAHSADDAPVLKPLVWRWLAASALAARAVMAFASARAAQGGDGATLVLLRKAGRARP
jgi:DNA-nicking Smr family endonuclease